MKKKKQKTSSDVFMTAPELAKRWNVHIGTLANWRSDETGPTYIKAGRKVLYKIQHVEWFEKTNSR